MALVVAWFAARLAVAQWLLDDVLAGLQIEDAHADVAELGTAHAVLSGVDLPGIGIVPRVDITYSIGGLLDGRIDTLRLIEPDLAVTLGADGAPQGALGLLLQGGGNGGPLPVEAIAVERGHLDLTAPGLWARAGIDGGYRFGDEDTGHVAWTAETAFGTLAGDADLAGLAAGTGHVEATFTAERLGYSTAVAARVSGHASVRLGSAMSALLSLQAEATTLDDHALGPLVLSGTWANGQGSFDADVGNAETAAALHLNGRLGGDGDGMPWTAGGLVTVAQEVALPFRNPVTIAAPGRLEFDLSGKLDDAGGWPGIAASGTLDLDVAGSGLEGIATTGPVALTASIDAGAGRLAVVVHDNLAIADIALSADGPWPAAHAERRFALTAPGTAITLVVRPRADDGLAVDTDLELALTDDAGFSLQATGAAAIGLDGFFRPDRVALGAVELALSGPFPTGMFDGDLTVSGSGQASPDGLAANLDIEGKLSRLDVAGISARGVSLTLPLVLEQQGAGHLRGTFQPVALIGADRLSLGDLTLGGLLAELPIALDIENDAVSVVLEEAGWIDIAQVSHPRLRSTEAMALKLEPDTLPLLVLEHLADEPRWDVRVLLAALGVKFDVLDGNGATLAAVAGTLPSIRVTLGRLGIDHIKGTAETSGGDLTVAGPDIGVSNIDALVSYNDGLSPWPEVQMQTLRLRDLTTPARFAPLIADVILKPVWPEGNDLRLTLDLHMPAHRYLANLEASWEPRRDRLTGYLRVPPIRFAPDFQPTFLSPLYGPLLTGASGTVEIIGALGMEQGVSTADLDILLNDISGKLAGADLVGLGGTVHLSDFAPLTTPPGQHLSATSIDPGIPLQDLALDFALPGDGTAQVAGASLGLAGGKVTAGPLTLDPERPENRVDLNVTGVDLERLADMLEMPEIQASGRLSGTIPVLLTDGDIAIHGGHLATDAPGVLRYLPEEAASLAAGDENVALVVNALQNFHYKSLSLDIDRELGGSSVVGLHIEGANPDLYDGYPIQLNVNLTGDLDKILRDSLAGWRIPEEIRQKLSGF